MSFDDSKSPGRGGSMSGAKAFCGKRNGGKRRRGGNDRLWEEGKAKKEMALGNCGASGAPAGPDFFVKKTKNGGIGISTKSIGGEGSRVAPSDPASHLGPSIKGHRHWKLEGGGGGGGKR